MGKASNKLGPCGDKEVFMVVATYLGHSCLRPAQEVVSVMLSTGGRTSVVDLPLPAAQHQACQHRFELSQRERGYTLLPL